MRQAALKVIIVLIKSLGVLTVFTGLALIGNHQFLWGLIAFIVGITTLGFHEEGWN
ncbi:MAG: hypothetical protein JG781_2551 [Peptococcaceae bacterium]|jgi:hypothetical protein|nr:hypothetical protein [Peptococcaceae bacterium]